MNFSGEFFLKINTLSHDQKNFCNYLRHVVVQWRKLWKKHDRKKGRKTDVCECCQILNLSIQFLNLRKKNAEKSQISKCFVIMI